MTLPRKSRTHGPWNAGLFGRDHMAPSHIVEVLSWPRQLGEQPKDVRGWPAEVFIRHTNGGTGVMDATDLVPVVGLAGPG